MGSAPGAPRLGQTHVGISKVDNGWLVNVSTPNPDFRVLGVGEGYDSAVHDTQRTQQLIATSREEVLAILDGAIVD